MNNTNVIEAIKNNIKQVIVGKDEIIDLMLVSLICNGHVLLEDVPGLGKTTLVSALACSLGCSFKRIQFTPDVLPSDLTGFNMYNIKTGEKQFQTGVLNNQIILADEINRTSPKTQSALLEAMEERQVTVDGTTYNLPRPFMVFATQNPIDMSGTYTLPEAQMDRFLMRIHMGYPSHSAEMGILMNHRSVTDRKKLSPVCTENDIIELQKSVANITVDQKIMEYIVRIVEATRNDERIIMGSSPRGSIALMHAACGYAVLNGRDYVVPDDVKFLADSVLSHRIIYKNAASGWSENTSEVIGSIVNGIKVPGIR